MGKGSCIVPFFFFFSFSFSFFGGGSVCLERFDGMDAVSCQCGSRSVAVRAKEDWEWKREALSGHGRRGSVCVVL